jgi:hypothetical protein
MRGYRVLKPNKKYEIEYFTEDKKERYLNRMIIIDTLLVVALIVIFFIVK